MTWFEKVRRRLRILFRKDDVEVELAEEVRLHLEMETAELVRRGWHQDGARREAYRRLGGVERTKEWVREERGGRLLDDLRGDLRYAVRTLQRAPGFAATVVLILALGIGANTAIFSLLDAAMWRILPVDSPEELWTIGDRYAHQEFRVLAQDETVLAGAAAYARARFSVGVDGSAEPPADGLLVSGGYFALLGVTPTAGRAIGPEDDRRPNGHPVAVISDGYWSRRFGRDPAAVGRPLTIAGAPFTVIGVAPPGFFGVEVGTSPDIFVSLMMQPTVMKATSPDLLADTRAARLSTWLRVLGRLQPGVGPERATSVLETRVRTSFLTQFGGVLPTAMPDDSVASELAGIAAVVADRMRPELTLAATGFSDLRQQFSRPLFILMGVVGILLLIACANTANLLLARATARRREFATRMALGAGRRRLIRQLLVESVLLAGLGGGVGVLLARWTTEFLVVFMSRGRSPIILDLEPNARVLVFTASVCIFTGILFGLIPALRATGLGVTSALKGGGRMTASRRRLAPDRVLAVSQIALSLVVLIGAGLFVRSLAALNERDSGAPRDRVLIAPIFLESWNDVERAERLGRTHGSMIRRIEAVPGVASASLAEFTPTSRSDRFVTVTTAAGAAVNLRNHIVYPRDFATMGIQLVAGRDFDAPDQVFDFDAPRVVIVNETYARLFWPGQSPVGKPCAGGFIDATRPCSIIGVVRDSPYADFTGEITATRYRPFQPAGSGSVQMALHVRTTTDPTPIIPVLRSEVSHVDARALLSEVRTLGEEVDAVMVQQRMIATLTSVFGVAALLLASVGLYGLLAFGVARRRAEIGLRIALGAGHREVIWMVMREALALVLLGGAVGLAIGLAAARLAGSQLSGLLFGVEDDRPCRRSGGIAGARCNGAARRVSAGASSQPGEPRRGAPRRLMATPTSQGFQ